LAALEKVNWAEANNVEYGKRSRIGVEISSQGWGISKHSEPQRLSAYFSPRTLFQSLSTTTMTETENQTKKGPVTKEKLHSVMEAASALTALGDEESENGEGAPSSPKIAPEESPDTTAAAATPKDDGSKRFLPDHKKPDAALTFPEKVSYILSRLQLMAITSWVCRLTFHLRWPHAHALSQAEPRSLWRSYWLKKRKYHFVVEFVLLAPD
jgi:hypothetical protein